jgi:hypothetical protein
VLRADHGGPDRGAYEYVAEGDGEGDADLATDGDGDLDGDVVADAEMDGNEHSDAGMDSDLDHDQWTDGGCSCRAVGGDGVKFFGFGELWSLFACLLPSFFRN